MNENYPHFKKIYVENSIKNHAKTKLILARLDYKNKIEYFDDINMLIKSQPTIHHPRERATSLVLSSIRGKVIRQCPGTHGHICCNYFVINQYIGCPIDCNYCILQGYLNQPFTIINVDIEVIFEELDKVSSNMADNAKIRIGTGELGDSLAYDSLTDFSLDFINYFRDKPQFVFEFKTKTTEISSLLLASNPQNIVVGYSLNPPSTAALEPFAAPVMERLKAAEALIKKGYKISLHFDPIMAIPNFKTEYSQLIDIIFEYIKPSAIAWISMGTFRYTQELKSALEHNYPHSKLLCEEFMKSKDQKFRYLKPKRITMYQTVYEKLISYAPDAYIYLCMESPEVWEAVLHSSPGGSMPFLFQPRNSIINLDLL